MSNYPIKINSTTIKTPKSGDFKISKFNLTKNGRVASGKMTMSLISKKVKLYLKYRVLTGIELDDILDEIDGSSPFFNVSYYDKRGVLFVKRFYSGEIPATLQNRGMNDNDDKWTDLDFHFIEQ